MAIATRAGSPQFPTAASDIRPSSQQSMDAAIADLQAKKDAWVQVPIRKRIILLDRLIRDCNAIAPRWVAACTQAKGIQANAHTVGEEWATGPYTLIRNLRLLRQSLNEIEKHGRPRIPGRVTTHPDGQVA